MLAERIAVALAAVVGLLALLVVAHQKGVEAERERWQAQQAKADRAMFERLAARSREVAALTARQQKVQQDAEVAHGRMVGEVERARAELARVRRLRDPGARPAGGCAVPAAGAGTGISTDSSPGAELSAGADEFLRQFAERADRTAAYATACYGWVKDLVKP